MICSFRARMFPGRASFSSNLTDSGAQEIRQAMIKSTTGFGRGKHEGERFACAVEIKSVNHRFLDPHLKLPPEFAGVELKLKRLIQSRIKRGRLDLFLNV